MSSKFNFRDYILLYFLKYFDHLLIYIHFRIVHSPRVGTLNLNKSNNVKIVGITNSQEITMKEFLNVLVNKGIIKSFSPIDFKFIGEYSYADNLIISDSPEKITSRGVV